ncbi:hypothetical protein ABID58_007267 [Bradyrhizobium sp. S3.2.6]
MLHASPSLTRNELEPAAEVRFNATRAAGTIDLIAPATEGIVDDITHGPLIRSSVPHKPWRQSCAQDCAPAVSRQPPSPLELPERHLQVGNKP